MDMFQYIENNGFLRQNDAIHICINLLSALLYIHCKNFIWDLKLEKCMYK